MRTRIQRAYGVGGPIIDVFPVPISAQRAPVDNQDVEFPQGQEWWDNSVSPPVLYIYNGDGTWATEGSGDLSQLTGNSGTAVVSAGNINVVGSGTLSFSGSGDTLTGSITPGSGLVATETGDTGTATPSSGNIQHAGTANQITTAASGAAVTYSLPSAITAPGSLTTTTTLEATTTITAGTGLTVTTGNMAVSDGDANVTGNVVATKSSAGANVTVQATNSDNTNAASNAGVEISAGGSSGGDPYLSFQVSGVGASTMTMGLDNSASDVFVISNSASIGTSNALTLTQGGALTTAADIAATTGNITATAGQLFAGGDSSGVASTISITNTNDNTIGLGDGSIKMASGNPATNTIWLKIYIGVTPYWIPAWTTNSP